MEDAEKGERIERGRIAKKELTAIIDIGFLDVRSIYFTHFWKNVSLFKALLLTNPKGRLGACMAQYLLMPHAPTFLKIYRRMRHKMAPADVDIVESLLFFTPSLHSLPLEPSLSTTPHPIPENELDRHPDLIAALKKHIHDQHRRRESKGDALDVLGLIDQLG